MTTATDETYDAYELSSGLIDDFDGTITEAYFGTDAAYNDGDTVLLILEISTDDPDRPSITEKLSTGTGWVIENQGANLVSENGKPRKFNKNSRVGLVLAAALQAGAGDIMRSKGSPMDAATWTGLGFHWDRKSIEGFNGEKKDVLLPTAVLGDSATTSSAPVVASGGVDAGTRAKLTVLAKKSDSYDAFVEAALEMDGVAANSDAVDLVVDEAFYAAANG